MKVRHLTGDRCASCGTQRAKTWFALAVRNGRAFEGSSRPEDVRLPLCGPCNCPCGKDVVEHGPMTCGHHGWASRRLPRPEFDLLPGQLALDV